MYRVRKSSSTNKYNNDSFLSCKYFLALEKLVFWDVIRKAEKKLRKLYIFETEGNWFIVFLALSGKVPDFAALELLPRGVFNILL